MIAKKTVIQLFGFMITITALMSFTLIMLIKNQYKTIESERIRYKSLAIANELRQSSEDLTNYCRLFIMTGDSGWETKYWNVLQIRNGKQRRPDGRQISLRDSMRKLGFTKHEFDLLSLAESSSNELVWTEKIAFNSFKGLFPDSLGVFSIQGEPNIEYAQEILFDENYLQAKAEIMQPIDQFIARVDKRTNDTVKTHRKATYLLLVSIAFILLAGIVTSFILFRLNIRQLKKQKRIDNELKNIKLNAEGSENKFRNLAENSPNMIFINQGGKIVYANRRCEEITGYTKEEFYSPDFDFMVLIEPEDKGSVMANFRNHIHGKEVPPSEYALKTKSGKRVEVIINTKLIATKGKRAILGIVTDITERKRNEKVLLENEARLQEAQILGKIGHWDLDLINNKLIWSDEVYRIFNLEPQEFKATYETFLEKVHPDDREKVNNAYKKSLKDKKPYQIEHRLLLKSGEIKYVIEQCKTEWDLDGKPLRSLGTVQDITEQKKAEEELILSKQKTEESEAKFRKLSNLTFEGILIHNNGVVIDLNRSLAKLIGYTRNELIGKNIIELVVPQKYKSIVSKKIKKKITLPYEIEIYKKDGSLIPVELEAKNIQIEGNNIDRVVAVRDISLRKKAEKEINKLSTAVNQSANIIVITDPDGNIEYVNPRFSSLTGYASEEVIGKNPRILNAGKLPKEHYINLWKTITKGERWKGEFFNKKKDGTFFWERATISPIRNEDEEIINYLAIKENITQQKEAAFRFKKQHQELKLAKIRAEESDKLKTAFLANISHEIRTPMNGILGFTGILKESKNLIHDEHQILEIIEKSSKRLLIIIEDLVSISKIDAGQMDLSISEINVNELFQNIHTSVKQEVENKEMQIFFRNPLPEDDVIVKTDLEKLFTIFTNLIKNSIKYSDKGSIEIGYEEREDCIEFFVKDTGIGIKQEHITLIFERFRQVSESNERKYEGTGLGLAITKAYVELLGGKIWVLSEEGKGSEFYFTIPYNIIREEKIGAKNIYLDN